MPKSELPRAQSRSERTLIAVLSEMRDPVIACNAHGQLVLFSRGAETLTGFSAGEALGEKACMLFVSSSCGGRINGLGKPEVAAELGGSDCVPVNRTVLIKRKNGLIVPVKMCARALQLDDGWGWLLRIEAADDALCKLDKRGLAAEAEDGIFRRLVMAVTDYAILMVDLKGRIQCWNEGATRLFGYTEAEVMGETVALLHTEDMRTRNALAEGLSHAEANGRCEMTGERVTKDGQIITIHGILNAIRDCDGHTSGYSLVLRHDEQS